MDCIFREVYITYEKKLKQAIQAKLVKLYRELSSRYNNMRFTDFSRNCRFVNEDNDVEIPEILNEREYNNKECSDFISSMLRHTYTIIDQEICKALERVHRENKSIIDLKSNIDLIKDTHKKSHMNGILCLGITNRNTVCSQLAVRNMGEFHFCKRCAKNVTIKDVPIRTSLEYTHKSSSNISNESDYYSDDNPIVFDTVY